MTFQPTQIGWWASASNIGQAKADNTFPLTSGTNSVTVSYAAFGADYGAWYAINASGGVNTTAAFVNVKDPQLSADIWDLDQGTRAESL